MLDTLKNVELPLERASPEIVGADREQLDGDLAVFATSVVGLVDLGHGPVDRFPDQQVTVIDPPFSHRCSVRNQALRSFFPPGPGAAGMSARLPVRVISTLWSAQPRLLHCVNAAHHSPTPASNAALRRAFAENIAC